MFLTLSANNKRFSINREQIVNIAQDGFVLKVHTSDNWLALLTFETIAEAGRSHDAIITGTGVTLPLTVTKLEWKDGN